MFRKNEEVEACCKTWGRNTWTSLFNSLMFLSISNRFKGPKKAAREVEGRPSYIISNHLTANSSETDTL